MELGFPLYLGYSVIFVCVTLGHLVSSLHRFLDPFLVGGREGLIDLHRGVPESKAGFPICFLLSASEPPF